MRLLEDHISPSELANLPTTPEALAAGDPYHQLLWEHLNICAECNALAQTHWSFRQLAAGTHPAGGSEMCVSHETWLELASGLPVDNAESLLLHAAVCKPCSETLKLALGLMQPRPTECEEPEADVRLLESTTAAWQARMAKQMVQENRKLLAFEPLLARTADAPRERRRIGWKVPFAVAAAFVIALGGTWLWRVANPSESRLLSMAYNKQRTLPLRIPGGEPVPLASITRGADDRLNEPSELAKLRARAREHLEKEPQNAYWHQVLGEVELLEGEDSAALVNLEFALNSNKASPNLLADKAAALFGLGVKNNSTQLFAQAADIYSQLISAHSEDAAMLYYNRALCWEHQNLRENAISDLRAALTLEKAPEWQKAIQAEIDRLAATSFSPSDGYETALQHATETVLPHWADSAQAREQIKHAAEMGLRHGDHWLAAWIASAHTSETANADQHLGASARYGAAGEGQESLAESEEALSLYTHAANFPGRIRAELAEVYALQRLDRASECLKAASRLDGEAHLDSFAWIQTQLILEEGSCSLLGGNYASAQRSFNQAVRLSIEHGLDLLHLRALGAQALLLDFGGSPFGGWQIDTDGLALCDQVHCPPIRRYEFVYSMAQAAAALGEHHVAAELMKTGEQLTAASGDLTAHAYAVETLAVLAGRAGEYTVSDRAFEEASTLAQADNPILKVRLYQAECQTDHAEILLRMGAPKEALALLVRNRPAVVESDYQLGRLHYFTQLSAAQLAVGDQDSALTSAIGAVREAELSLSTVSSSQRREQWQRENAPAYAQLIKVYLQRNESYKAFATWERSRALAFEDLHVNPLQPISEEPRLGSNEAIGNRRVLVIALIGDNYVGWLVALAPVRVLRTISLGSRAAVLELATAFYHLCSQPESSLSDVKAIAGRLYSVLLAPFADQLSSSALWIEVDPSLASIPFSALLLPDGRWLDAAYQIRILPEWWAVHPEILADEAPLPSTARVLVANGFAPAQGVEARSDFSEAATVAHMFPRGSFLEGETATPQRFLTELKSAEAFHFGGHAIVDAQSNDILLASSRVSADSLRSLDLRQCRIAVLAACNTTASDPDQAEPASDLRNALLAAGVHAVIASHWDVDDRSTRALMLDFYHQIVQGSSPANSLQTAEQKVRSDPKWQHPYYWASFQLFAN
jgi:hypothetical protein